MRNEYCVPKENLKILENKIFKLNKTALKLKCKPIKITSKEDYTQTMSDGIRTKDFTKLTIEGESPKINVFKKDENTVIWFSSDKKLDIGSYKIKATVKEHKVYMGEKQTIITRAIAL